MISNVHVERIGRHSGLLVQPASHADLMDLERTAALSWLASDGFVVLRGFGGALEHFADFARRFLSPEQVFRPGTAEVEHVGVVDDGQYPIPFHAEYGSLPLRPDVLWFACVSPAGTGGQTTVCDGIRVGQALRVATRKLFEERRLRFYGALPPGLFAKCQAAFADDGLRRIVERPDTRWSSSVNADGTVSFEYFVPAFFPSLFGDKAFANALIPQHRLGRVTFEDGTAVPEAAIREVEEVTDQLTELIPWIAGDVAMLDNSRLMHGRRGFAGPRSIRSTFGRIQ